MNIRVFGAALAATALIAGTVRADDKPITFVRTFKEATTSNYKVTISTNVMGMDVTVKTGQKIVIKTVKKDGSAVHEVTPEASVINIGGNDMEQEGGKPFTETRDKYNKLTEYKNEQDAGFMAPEIQKLSATCADVIFTDKAVKPGDSWETEIDNPVVAGKKFKIKTTYVGSEKLDGVDVLKLKQTFTAEVSKEGEKTSGETTYLLDATTYETLRAESTTKDIPTQVGPVTLAMKMNKVVKK